MLGASYVELVFLSNWGNSDFIGITGLEIMGAADEPIEIEDKALTCSVSKSRKLMRIKNGNNVTTDRQNMWIVPYFMEEEVLLKVDFDKVQYISGLRIWNYNENLEMSYAGVKSMRILLDGSALLNPVTKTEEFLLRRAPGNEQYDYGQEIKFYENNFSSDNTVSTELQQCNFVTGFVIQMVIYSTWEDRYYCGLNGIEIYDHLKKKIELEEQSES